MAEETYHVYIQKAKLAEETSRYDDMVKYLKSAVYTYEFKYTDVSLLKAAYRNSVKEHLSTWKTLSDIKLKETGNMAQNASTFKSHVAQEIADLCDEFLTVAEPDILFRYCFDHNVRQREEVGILNARAEFHRYKAETATAEEELLHLIKYAKEAYHTAMGAACLLRPTDVYRLEAVIGNGDFFHDILKNHDTALTLGREHFNSALTYLQQDPDDVRGDSTVIMSVLQDRLKTWRPQN